MVVYLSVALIYALLCFSYVGFWNAMDPEPHLGVFDDEYIWMSIAHLNRLSAFARVGV